MDSHDPNRKLFIGGLPFSADEAGVRALFTEVGCKLVDVSLPMDRETGRPKGFAFVVLAEGIDRDATIRKLSGRNVEGRSITVRAYHADGPGGSRGESAPRRDRGPRDSFSYGSRGDSFAPRGGGGAAGGAGPAGDNDRKLYLGNLPLAITEEELRAELATLGLGAIQRMHMPVDERGVFRGYAFATLASAEAAEAAIQRLAGARIGGRQVRADRARSGPSRR